MNNVMISLFIAAGSAAFAYSKLGNRIGYGNSQRVWLTVAAVFVFVFGIFIILLSTLLHLNK